MIQKTTKNDLEKNTKSTLHSILPNEEKWAKYHINAHRNLTKMPQVVTKMHDIAPKCINNFPKMRKRS